MKYYKSCIKTISNITFLLTHYVAPEFSMGQTLTTGNRQISRDLPISNTIYYKIQVFENNQLI